MALKPKHIPISDTPVVLHQGVFKKTATLPEAVFMITGMTIGAGILGLPYAVARFGLIAGVFSIVFVGLLMMAINLMIGEMAIEEKSDMQLPGFAGKYLGPYAKILMTVVTLLGYLGTLLAYLVGESISLSALVGGNELLWGVIFWSFVSFIIWLGLNSVKKIDKILGIIVIALIIFVVCALFPHIKLENLVASPIGTLTLPFGVIIFALHATPAIAEAHALLPKSKKTFRKALVIGTLIPIAVYVLFSVAVIGALGLRVPQLATVGIGDYFGDGAVFISNIFAVLAMTTCYIGLGTALKETLVWDHKIPEHLAVFLVVVLPLMLFLAGLRNFVAILDVVGGLFVGIEIVLMIAVFVAMQMRKNKRR